MYLLLVNANVITMNPTLPKAKSIHIRNGKIASVSAEHTPSLWRCTSSKGVVLDCQGKTVVPGFIDSHCHLFSYASSLKNLDMGPRHVSSIDDMQNLISKAARELPPGTWIMGGGYNEFYLAEKRHPTRWDLDTVSPDHPVRITHRTGYAHVLNSLALERVGISKETGDPPGGLIDRDITTGEPTGLLYGMGKTLAKFVAVAQNSQAEEGIRLACQALNEKGITSIHDASARNDPSRIDLFRSWQKRGDLPQRVSTVLGWETFHKINEHGGAPQSDDFVRIEGVKIIIHEITGQLSPSQSELNEMVLLIHQAGYRAVIHAVEEKHIIAACEAIEQAMKLSPAANYRHRIEHCSVCPPALAKRLASAGIMVVTQPAFVYYNGERYLRTVPQEDLRHLYPVATLLRQGVKVAGSSDFPIVPANPLIGIYSAVTRKAENGEQLVPEERITPLEALSLFTVNAAGAICAESTRGSIQPGKFADLAILSDDPTGVPEEAIKDIRVDMTIINGQVTWERR